MEKQDETPRHLTLEEAALHAVPDILRVSTTKKSEEMLSNQAGFFYCLSVLVYIYIFHFHFFQETLSLEQEFKSSFTSLTGSHFH